MTRDPRASSDNVPADAPRPPQAPVRKPYVAPQVVSGDAFERVQLQSGGTPTGPDDCPP